MKWPAPHMLLLLSCSVMSDSLQPHGLQHARLPCSHHLLEFVQMHVHWVSEATNHLIHCYPLSSCFQSFPASGSFLTTRLFISDGRSIGASALATFFLMNIQDWFPLGLTGWISLQSKELSRGFSNITVQKHQFFGAQRSLWSNSHIHTSHNINYRVQLSHLYITTRKTIALTIPTSYGIWEKVNNLYLLC